MDSHTARFAFVRNHPVITFFVITFLIGYIAALSLFFTRISVFGSIAASVVVAVLVSVTSPIFRTPDAALFRRRLSQPSILEVAEHARI